MTKVGGGGHYKLVFFLCFSVSMHRDPRENLLFCHDPRSAAEEINDKTGGSSEESTFMMHVPCFLMINF